MKGIPILATAPLLTATPSGDVLELRPGGSWTAANAPTLEAAFRRRCAAARSLRAVKVDMAGVRELDTLGAWLLEKMSRRATSAGHRADIVGVADNYAGLIEEVRQVNRHNPAPAPARNPLVAKLSDLGRATIGATRRRRPYSCRCWARCSWRSLGVLRRPRSLRLTSLVYQLYRVGWQAIPIIVLITFLIGAIIAQQGFFHFRKFGADSYVVDMVGILVLRELGVLIVAIMVAGRSGSAYTAELGSMKMREEIDALSTMGLDPVEVLILPRVVALIMRAADPEPSSDRWRRSMAAAWWRSSMAAWGRRSIIARLHEAVSVTHLRGRHHQGAVHGAGDRHRRLQRGPAGEGQRRVARQADHDLGGEVDLPGDRARRAVRGVLCIDRNVAMQEAARQFAIRVRDLVVGFGRQVVIDHLSLDVRRGEILGLVGASGGGKSVLMRTIIGLIPRQGGEIEVMGAPIGSSDDRDPARRGEWGILFQQGALFSSLTVRQNIQFPLRENLVLSDALMDEIATAKLEMVGLAGRGRRQVSVRTVGRHDQARGAGARARARSRDRVSRRADLGARPDRGRRFRRPDQDTAENAGADRVHGHP